MNLVETHDLLTLAAKYDNRRFDDATVVAWREVLADLPFEDCRNAVVAHFANSDSYLMPVHVRRRALELDRDRRRRIREEREAAERLAIEADPSRKDRSEEVEALLTDLREALPPSNPNAFKRSEWVDADRRRVRASEEPLP